MDNATKGQLSHSDEESDRGRFAESLRALRGGLDEVEATCVDDVVFRDTAAAACDSVRLQLALISRRCESRGGQ